MNKLNLIDNIKLLTKDWLYLTSTGYAGFLKNLFLYTMDANTLIAGGVITGWDLRTDPSDSSKLSIWHNNSENIGVAFDRYGNPIITSTGYTNIILSGSINYVTLKYKQIEINDLSEPNGRLDKVSGQFYNTRLQDSFDIRVFSSSEWALILNKNDYVMLGQAIAGTTIVTSSTGKYYISSLIQSNKIDTTMLKDALALEQTQIANSAIYNDNYVGVPGDLQADLNQIRSVIKIITGNTNYNDAIPNNLRSFDEELTSLHNNGVFKNSENELYPYVTGIDNKVYISTGKALANKRIVVNTSTAMIEIESAGQSYVGDLTTSTGELQTFSGLQGQTISLDWSDIVPGSIVVTSNHNQGHPRYRIYEEGFATTSTGKDYYINYLAGTIYNIPFDGDIANETVRIYYRVWNDRYDLVEIQSDGALYIKHGGPSDKDIHGNPIPPVPDFDKLVLAQVHVTSTGIVSLNDLEDARIFLKRISRSAKIDGDIWFPKINQTPFPMDGITFHSNGGAISTAEWSVISDDCYYDGGAVQRTSTSGAYVSSTIHSQNNDVLYLITTKGPLYTTANYSVESSTGTVTGSVSLYDINFRPQSFIKITTLTYGYHKVTLTCVGTLDIDYLVYGSSENIEFTNNKIGKEKFQNNAIKICNLDDETINYRNLNGPAFIIGAALKDVNYDDGEIINKEVIYNPEVAGKDAWTAKANLNIARFISGGFSLGGYGYIVGGDLTPTGITSTGLTSTGLVDIGIETTSVEQYNDDLNTWSVKASLNIGRYSLTAFNMEFNSYVTGGSNSILGILNSTEQYDDVLNSWTMKDTLNTARRDLASFVINQRAYAVGGYNSGALNINEYYDENLDSWNSIIPAVNFTAASNAAGFSLNNFGYFVGGNTNILTSTGYTSATYRYYDATNTWYSKSDLLVAIDSMGGFSLNSFGYVFGGRDAFLPLKYTEKYLDSADIWIAQSEMTNYRYGLNGFSVDGKGYACGGNGPVNTVTQYENCTMYNLGSYKSTILLPKTIKVATSACTPYQSLPIELRTTSTGIWYQFESNRDEILKTGEELLTKFQATSTGFYNYQIKVGLPSIVDPQGYWTTVATLTNATYSNADFSLNDYGYTTGGTPNGSTTYGYVQRYNDILNSMLTTNGELKGDHGAFSLGGYGFIFGGLNFPSTSLDTTYKYDDTSESWTVSGNCSDTIYITGTFILDRKGYFAGGIYSDSTYQNEVDSFDGSSWNLAPANLGTGVEGNVGFSTLSYGYSVSGIRSGASYTAASFKYDSTGNVWSSAGSVITQRRNMCSFTLYNFGYIVAGEPAYLSSVERYNENLTTWTSATSVTTAAYYLGGFSLHNYGYKTGGYTGTPSLICEKYTAVYDFSPVILGEGFWS